MSISLHDDILDLANGLLEGLDELSLNEIDGAFYSQICLRNQRDALAEAAERVPDRNLNFLDGVPIDDFAEFRSAWKKVMQVFPDLEDVLNGKPLLMRDALIRVVSSVSEKDSEGKIRYRGQLAIGVTDGSWTGTDVVKALHRWTRDMRLRKDPYWLEIERDAEIERSVDHLNIISSFKSRGEFELPVPEWLDPLKHDRTVFIDHAMIVLHIAYPLPPDEVIEAYFNSVIVDQLQWTRRITPRSNGQKPLSAIRGWAIGLLHTSGMTQDEAIRAVTDRLGLSTFTATTFANDRNAILDRVPEAEWHLMTRPFISHRDRFRENNPKRTRKG